MPGPVWPGLVTVSAGSCTAGSVTTPFPCFSGVRVFSRDYANPRIYTTNVGYEQEIAQNFSFYLDFTHAKGVHLTRFLDYALSDRDIRHRFNAYTNVEIPAGFELNARVQARTAQPKSLGCASRCFPRNTIHKNNEFFSFDWRLQRPLRFSGRLSLIPIVEMFNTFNTDNNIDPTVGSSLFNFDGFLRQGVGDPRQLQLAVKLMF